MTAQEIDAIAEAAAEKAVKSMLLSLGINVSDPDEIVERQADFKHLRAWRESTEAVKKRALLTAVAVVVTGALGWIAVAFKWPGATP